MKRKNRHPDYEELRKQHPNKKLYKMAVRLESVLLSQDKAAMRKWFKKRKVKKIMRIIKILK